MVMANKLGNQVAKGISEPLEALGERFKTFAQGDLSTPFPEVSTQDEVADMAREAADMADKLNLIINDAGRILGLMSQGNYAVQSEHKDGYTLDFEKLIVAMRVLRDQMIETLTSIEDAANQVSAGSWQPCRGISESGGGRNGSGRSCGRTAGDHHKHYREYPEDRGAGRGILPAGKAVCR